jgi:hypothetical protein
VQHFRLSSVVTGNGLDSEHVTFRLHPQVLIYGRITDQNGEPVRNASVHLFSVSRNSDQLPSMQAQQQTNDLGEYRFAHLFAGRYFVAVQAQPWYAQTGFIYVPVETSGSHDFSHMPGGKSDPSLDVVYPITFYPGVTDERSAGELTLSEGESAQANIPLRTVPAVHLRVTNLPANENSPVAVNAFQRVFGTIPLGLQFQTAEVSPGEAEIAGLPPGELTFNVNRGQTATLERTMEANVGGSETLDASKPLPSATVSGRVVLPEDSVPIRDGNIMLLKAGDPTPFIHLEKDGSFAFGALPKGTYKVAVNLPGEPRYVQKVSASGATVSGRDIVITGTTDVRLTIVMGRGFGQVSGVVLRDNHGVDGVMVLLIPDAGINLEDDSRLDQSDSDGSFQLGGIIPGKYRLLAIQDGWSLDRRNLAVLKPYLEKSELLQISSGESRKITVEVQKRVAPTALAN